MKLSSNRRIFHRICWPLQLDPQIKKHSGFMAGSKLVGIWRTSCWRICSRFLRLLSPGRDGFSFRSLFLHCRCLLSRVRCLRRTTLSSTGRLDSAELFELLFVQEIQMILENETLQSQEEYNLKNIDAFTRFFRKDYQKTKGNRSWSTKYWFFRLRRTKTKNSIANLSLIRSI